jgi:predicted RNA-binding Zn ribbon-like protein
MTMNTEIGADATAQMTAATDEAVHRIRELTDRFIESAMSAGNQSLDAYEQSLRTLIEFQEGAARASQLDWVSSVAAAHAKFVQDVSAAYVSAAREMLK